MMRKVNPAQKIHTRIVGLYVNLVLMQSETQFLIQKFMQ